MYKGKTIFTIFSVTILLAVVCASLFFVSKNNLDTSGQSFKADVKETVLNKEINTVSLSDEDLAETEEDKLPFLLGQITGGTRYTPEDVDLVDVFIINGNSVAALSTSTGDRFSPFEGNNNTIVFNKIYTEYKKGDYLTYDFSVDKLREYNHSVTVVILGSAEGHYTFSGIVLDEKNEPRDFSYTLMTKKGYKHEFEFDFDTGEVSVSQSDYSDLYNHEEHTDYEELVSDDCDVVALETSLNNILSDSGFNFDMKNRFSANIEILETYPYKSLFGEVCTLTVSFLEKEGENNFFKNNGNFVGEYKKIEVNGEEFDVSYADGPTASLVGIPIKTDENHVQWLESRKIYRAIPINFPELVLCPCLEEYVFSITEPVYVEPKEE